MMQGDQVSLGGERRDRGLKSGGSYLVGESVVVSEDVPPLVHKLLEHHTRDLSQRTISLLGEGERGESDSGICERATTGQLGC